MKSFKSLIESNKGYKDVSHLFPKDVMTAYISNDRSSLSILSVPEGERSNKQKLNVSIKWSDYKDDNIVVLKSHDGNIYYWIIKEYGWELLNDTGHEISSIPYKAVHLDKIYKKVKKEIK